MSETMQHTANYGLSLPSEDDFFDIGHFNRNSELVDDALGGMAIRLDGVSEDIATQLDAFRKKSWSLNVSTSWSGSSAPYSQTITAEDITSEMDVIVDAVLSGTTSNKLAQIEAMGMVSELVTGDGSVTLYCYDSKPTIAFTIRIREV